MSIYTKTINISAQVLRHFGYDFNEENNEQVKEMKKEIAALDGGIEFKIEQFPDGSWTAESVNIDGIITGGDNIKNSAEMIRDAIFTYYRVPPQFCNDASLLADNEPITVRQKVYV